MFTRNLFVALALALFATPALAEDKPVFNLTLKDNKFDVEELKVPANKDFTIVIKNNDASAEEFEIESLDIEKIISGNAEGKVNVPALEAGTYEFMGEFHADSAKGVLVAE